MVTQRLVWTAAVCLLLLSGWLPSATTVDAGPTASPGAMPPEQRAALVAFYTSTGGANWTGQAGWLGTGDACGWYGIRCLDGRNVFVLRLPNNNLTGVLPPEIGNLPYLQMLELNNNSIGGSIPSTIGNLAALKYIHLEKNRLEGAIPSTLGNLTNLELVYLSANRLGGPLPGSLGQLKKLTTLDLHNNRIDGAIPSGLGDMAALSWLDLSQNRLAGALPPELGKLANLQALFLNSNQLEGPLPSSLGDLAALQQLVLSTNQISGPIPASLGGLPQLSSVLLFSNKLDGPIPPELGNMPKLSDLWLSFNQLDGEIPPQLAQAPMLYNLLLNDNQLTGDIPDELTTRASLVALNLAQNELTGRIPAQIGALSALGVLNLQGNDLEGGAPASLGQLLALRALALGDNPRLEGPLPAGLTALHQVNDLNYARTGLCMPDNDAFRDWLEGVDALGSVATSWKVCGLDAHLSFSTPNALTGDVVLMHARLVDDELGRIKGSTQVSAILTGEGDALSLVDNGSDGDLLGMDGHYSRWVTVGPEEVGIVEADLYYKGWPVISATVSLISDPELIVLTDLRRLNDEFTLWGATPGEDLDGNDTADFYDLLDRQWRYADKYRGIVYDLGHTITTGRGFADDYDPLDPRPEYAERRMGSLIRELMTQLYAQTGAGIEYLVIAGSRPVVPTFTIDLVGQWDKHDIRRTDIPYAIRSFTNALEQTRPAPDIPYGRISAGRPGSLAALFDIYDQPLVTDPAANAFTFYREDDSAFMVWAEDWEPWVTARFAAGDLAAAPLYAPGRYYNYEGSVTPWSDVDVLNGLRGAAWTVINSHADPESNNTQSSTQTGPPSSRLAGTDYPAIPRQPGHLYINAGCNAGFPPAANSSVYISQAVMDRHITYVGNTWYGKEYDDTLWVAFADQLTSAASPTVGAAWIGAFGPYWARYASTDKNAVVQAYTKALYGLPTQPLQHAAPAQASVSAEPQSSTQSAASPRELNLTLEIPHFIYEQRGAGTVVRPANSGSVLAEEGRPMLPLVSARVLLPAGATAITVSELAAQRQTENAGQVDLLIAEMPVRCGLAEIEPMVPTSGSAYAGAYPAESFRANVVRQAEGWVIYLSAIPAGYAADRQLTLLHRMVFRIRYELAAPDETVSLGAVTVNNGLPLRTGQAAVPLKVAISAASAMSLTVAYQVADPGGFALADQRAIVNLPAGAGQVAMVLDTRGWQPGPKQLNVTLVGRNGILDAGLQTVTAVGLRLELKSAARLLPGDPWPLEIAARDELGAPVTDLAARFTLTLDGAAIALTIAESAPGVYRVTVPPAALPAGPHRAAVTVTDPRGCAASATGAVVVDVVRQDFLPLARR